jgi:hypothetical protein
MVNHRFGFNFNIAIFWVRLLVMKYALIILVLTAPVFAQAAAKEITDAESASIIAQANRDAYHLRGQRCACPEDLAADGSRCGRRSAYSKPGGSPTLLLPFGRAKG